VVRTDSSRGPKSLHSLLPDGDSVVTPTILPSSDRSLSTPAVHAVLLCRGLIPYLFCALPTHNCEWTIDVGPEAKNAKLVSDKKSLN
jgi:hypothetical protein